MKSVTKTELDKLVGKRFRKLFSKYGYYVGVVTSTYSVAEQTVDADFGGEVVTVTAREALRLCFVWDAKKTPPPSAAAAKQTAGAGGAKKRKAATGKATAKAAKKKKQTTNPVSKPQRTAKVKATKPRPAAPKSPTPPPSPPRVSSAEISAWKAAAALIRRLPDGDAMLLERSLRAHAADRRSAVRMLRLHARTRRLFPSANAYALLWACVLPRDVLLRDNAQLKSVLGSGDENDDDDDNCGSDDSDSDSDSDGSGGAAMESSPTSSTTQAQARARESRCAVGAAIFASEAARADCAELLCSLARDDSMAWQSFKWAHLALILQRVAAQLAQFSKRT